MDWSGHHALLRPQAESYLVPASALEMQSFEPWLTHWFVSFSTFQGPFIKSLFGGGGSWGTCLALMEMIQIQFLALYGLPSISGCSPTGCRSLTVTWVIPNTESLGLHIETATQLAETHWVFWPFRALVGKLHY